MCSEAIQLIPVGRTARLPRGLEEIQLQTEYASRPSPRITSCILVSGRLIHKIETPLATAVATPEEMAHVERLLGRQHAAVYRLITDPAFRTDGGSRIDAPELNVTGGVPLVSISAQAPFVTGEVPLPAANQTHRKEAVTIVDPTYTESEKVRVQKRTTLERLYAIEGVEKVYSAGGDGKILSEKLADEFRKTFNKIAKSMDEIVQVFAPLANGPGREEGICELEPRRLYMVSHFGNIYFLVIKRMPSGRIIEEVIKEALYS